MFILTQNEEFIFNLEKYRCVTVVSGKAMDVDSAPEWCYIIGFVNGNDGTEMGVEGVDYDIIAEFGDEAKAREVLKSIAHAIGCYEF